MKNQDFIVKLSTVQSKIIKVLFEVLKEVLIGTANLIFTPKGIHLLKENGTQKVVVLLKLDAENFEEYICNTDKCIVGIDTNNINKITKSIQNKDTINFYILKDSPNYLIISRINSETSCEYNHGIKLCQVPYEYSELEESPEYAQKLTLKSSEFQVACKNLNSLNCDLVNISYTNEYLIINSRNEFCENEIVIKQQMLDDEDLDDFNNSDNPEDITNQGYYMLQYLLLFSKATSLDKNFDILLNPDNSVPLTLCYAVGNLGSLDFMLKPEEIIE